MTLFVTLALGAAGVYAGIVLLIWRFQERVVFQPPPVSQRTAQTRRVWFRTDDGADLFAHVVGQCPPGATVVLAFHGNAEIAWWRAHWAVELARAANACFVLAEYRGYDGLPGNPTYEASALDALAALRYVRDVMGIPLTDIVYFGHSLGSAIAAELATEHPPRSLILQAPFSSAMAMAQRYVFAVPAGLLSRILRVRFDTVARVGRLRRPVWVAHGERDVIVPVRMGRAVFEAGREKGELLLVAEAGHNDIADVGGSAYMDWFVRAVRDARPEHAIPAAPGEIRSAP